MKPEEKAKQRKRILALDGKWGPLLGLRWWKVTHEYCEGREEMPDGARGAAVAACTVKWEYGLATISWYMPGVAELSEAELEEVYIHEALHVLVNEMREKGIKHEERVVTALTNAIKWVGESALKGAKAKKR